MKPHLLSCFAAATILFPVAGSAQSPWLPAPHRVEVTPRYVYESFDTFWMGSSPKVSLPDNVVQQSALLTAEYGLNTDWALDSTLGYAWVDTAAFGQDASDSGLADTRLGARWRFVDEQNADSSWWPTLSLRAGAIIAGTYDEGLPFSAGDGAHGGEFSLLFGKTIGTTGFGFYGDVGYRVREHPVPNDLFGSIGIFQSLGPVTLGAGYRHCQGLDGKNIGDPGFTFPELKEVTQLFEFGVGFRDKRGLYYQAFGALSVDGQNTGDKLILGVSFTFGF